MRCEQALLQSLAHCTCDSPLGVFGLGFMMGDRLSCRLAKRCGLHLLEKFLVLRVQSSRLLVREGG